MARFDRRVALVTGGTRGIGAAISKALKASGYKVAASYAGNDAAAELFHLPLGICVHRYCQHHQCDHDFRFHKEFLAVILPRDSNWAADNVHIPWCAASHHDDTGCPA